MKITTFDKTLIRQYMENSSVLEQGMHYARITTRCRSDEEAKETAIQLAQDYCYRIWYNDNTGYIDTERRAFSEFVSDVEKGKYFYTKSMLEAKKQSEETAAANKIQDNLRKQEAERVEKLRLECQEKRLDFETENNKRLKSYNTRRIVAKAIRIFALIIATMATFSVEFIPTEYLAFVIPGGIVAGIILLIIADKIAPPALPKELYDKVMRKK